jgi:spermidine synthase
MEILRIFLAVFFSGIASLQVELSLLREATFILGSTAFTNSYIISIFLSGLALGSYGGNILVRLFKGKARGFFLISQAINILLLLFFLYTKNFIFYGNLGDYARLFIIIYFGFITIVPSIVAGMSFAFFLNMLYEFGEQHIALVYAISTAGNVLGGLNHGIVLVPYYGMLATYLVAIVSTGLAMLCIARLQWLRVVPLILLVGGSIILATRHNPMPTAMKKALLWSKDDIYGLVQVVDRSDKWKGQNNERGIDLLIHNRHNCSNAEREMNWHKASARYAMELLDNSAKDVLMLGYCSGSTILHFLSYQSVSKVIAVDMNKAVMEASRLFFPHIHEAISKDNRAVVIVDEFRNYLRRQPSSMKYDIVIIDITIDDPYYLSMFTREFFEDIYKYLQNPGVMFFNSYQEFLRTGADVFDHLFCVKNLEYEKSFFFFTNFSPTQEKSGQFYEAFPTKQTGRVYTNGKVYRVEPSTPNVREECLS